MLMNLFVINITFHFFDLKTFNSLKRKTKLNSAVKAMNINEVAFLKTQTEKSFDNFFKLIVA